MMDKYSERREQKQQTGWIDFAEPHLILYKYSNYNPFPDFIGQKILYRQSYRSLLPEKSRFSLFPLMPQPGNRHTAGDTAENTHYSGPEIFRKIPYPGIQAQSNTRS